MDCNVPQTGRFGTRGTAAGRSGLAFFIYVKRKRNHQIEKQRLGIDLGWYPDGAPAGCFCLRAVLNGNWEQPLLEFSSRSKKEVVEKLEQWLFNDFMPVRYIE